MGVYVFPKKIVHSPWGSGPPSNAWHLGFARVINPNGISIGPVIFVWSHVNGVENPQNCPFSLGVCHPARKDQATTISDTHKNLVKIARLVRKISLQTDRQTDRHTQTRLLQYFADAPAGEVTIKTECIKNVKFMLILLVSEIIFNSIWAML